MKTVSSLALSDRIDPTEQKGSNILILERFLIAKVGQLWREALVTAREIKSGFTRSKD
jgi:hypothetical protein